MIRRKLLGAFFGFILLFSAVIPRLDFAQGAFYMELAKNGRIYVFNDPKAYQEFLDTGDIEKKITRIGEGPNGETMVFDSDNAIHMYNFKHNRPAEVIIKTEPAAPALQEKLPYKFSGYMFGDYFYHVQRDPNIAALSNVALPGAEDFNAFQFRRIYFTFDDNISDDFFARFRLESDQVALTTDLKTSVFVKDAYLQWKNAFSNNDFYFGVHPTPAYEISEAAWGFRSLEKTIMDLRGIVPSRDFGVSLRGKFDNAGKYNYWVEAGNNSGNRPEVDKYKRFYFQFWGKPSEKFQFTVYHDRRGNPKIVDPNTTLTTLDNDIWVTAFFANYYKKDVYSLGFEAFFQNTKDGFIHGTAPAALIDDKHGVGYSGWGWYSFTPKIGVVGRYDFFDPNTDSAAKGDARDLFIGSLFIKPIKNVYIMPNIYVEKYQKLPTGQTFKTSVTPRITLYYIFLS